MDSTYIIVFNDEDGKPNNKYAMIKVIKFEPYISLRLDCKLFDNYNELNKQMLEGGNINFGVPKEPSKQIEFSHNEYETWSKSHVYMYDKIAEEFTPPGTKDNKKWTFFYKRKLDTNIKSFKVQPIACESDSVILSIDNSAVDINDSDAVSKKIQELKNEYLSDANISQLATELTKKNTCDEICKSALKLFCNITMVNSQTKINEIHTIVKSTFDKLDKTNLDDLEPKLIGLRDNALRSIPINMVNVAYRDLNNAGFNLSAKRDAYNKMDKILKDGVPTIGTEIATNNKEKSLQDVKDAAEQIVQATYEMDNEKNISFNILTGLETTYNSMVGDIINKLKEGTGKL